MNACTQGLNKSLTLVDRLCSFGHSLLPYLSIAGLQPVFFHVGATKTRQQRGNKDSNDAGVCFGGDDNDDDPYQDALLMASVCLSAWA